MVLWSVNVLRVAPGTWPASHRLVLATVPLQERPACIRGWFASKSGFAGLLVKTARRSSKTDAPPKSSDLSFSKFAWTSLDRVYPE